MATDPKSKSLFELVTELGDLLVERQRLIEESLPPCLRKGYQDPVIVIPDFCEAEVAYDHSSTGEDAYTCSSTKNLCLSCGFCDEHCICSAGAC